MIYKQKSAYSIEISTVNEWYWYACLSPTLTGAQHCVHSLPRYPSSKPDQKTSILPSLSEQNFNSYSEHPMQLQTYNTPQDEISTMNVGNSTHPVHDNGYNKYPREHFNPNQANGNHDRKWKYSNWIKW